MKCILITGGAGFIGLNFIPIFLKQNPKYKVINLDLLTYASNTSYISKLRNNERYYFVKGDICNRQLLEHLFAHFDVRGVIHFAAESHVDNSINNPEVFMKTNVIGTFNLLDVARKYWMSEPFQWKEGYRDSRFHHISTDEVYGSLSETGYFTEETSYAPNSPYSASKASSDLVVRSYFHTYGMNVVTTNCSNNYGPHQHLEKLIPTIITKALSFKDIPIYGDGKNVRDWLYVEDHCKAIDLVFHKGRSGETYNIGGDNERSNNYIANYVCELLDYYRPLPKGSNTGFSSYKQLIKFIKDRPGHDRRYAIDASKIKEELKWHIEEGFESGIKKTVEWYLSNEHK
ncbi:dTDP-glucose 4,6-dehydratase [Paenibacillus hodogayensis]|uniref:dTDP-glucose 4,6-dehydratase n=1 Tax=Paenibacillus hodogayensis TaxID=279208 RepID=A0ABV5VSD2_9BACL